MAAVEVVNTGAAAAFVANDAGGFENLEVAGGGRPGVAEEARNFAHGQMSAGEIAGLFGFGGAQDGRAP